MADGIEIATAYVKLIPSLERGQLSREFGAVGPLADKAGSTSGKRFGSKFAGAMRSPIGKVGATLAGAFAVDKVKDFLQGSIEEARESQKVSAQTASVIKATGGAAGVSAGQIGKLAAQISSYAGIDDEVIQGGANMLLTFKNIRNEAGKGNDVFNQATRTLTDMSVAMGVEPQKAAIQLGKALNDPVKGISALSRVGVTFDAQQTKTIQKLVKTGDTMKAQKVILRELNSEFGGSAKAQATAGDKMSVAWGNLKEQIGTALLPTLDDLEGTVSKKIIPAVSGFLTEMQTGKGKGGKFVDFMKDLGDVGKNDVLPVIKGIASVGGKVVDFFDSMPGPVRQSAVALGLVGLGAAKIGPSIAGMVSGMRDAETGAVRMTGKMKLAAGAGGVLALGTSMKSAKDDGAGLSNMLSGTLGGAMTGLAVGGPIGALIGGAGGAGLTALAGAFHHTDDAAKNNAKILNSLRTGKAIANYDDLRSSLDESTGAFTKNTRAAIENWLQTDKVGKQVKATLNKQGVGDRSIIAAALGNPSANARLLDTAASQVETLSNKIRKLKTLQVNNAGGLVDLPKGMSQDDLAKQIKALEGQKTALQRSTAALTGESTKLKQASRDQREFYRSTTPIAKQLGITRKEFKAWPKSLRTELNLDGVPKSRKGLAQVAHDAGDLTRRQWRVLLEAAGVDPTRRNIAGVQTLADKLGRTHPTTTLSADDKASAKIREIKSMYDNLPRNVVTTITTLHESKAVGGGRTPGHNASGTRFWRGGLTVVGETGPELISLQRGAEIFSNQRSREMFRQATATAAPVAVAVTVSGPFTLTLDDGTQLTGRMEAIADDRVAAAAAMNAQMGRAVYS